LLLAKGVMHSEKTQRASPMTSVAGIFTRLWLRNNNSLEEALAVIDVNYQSLITKRLSHIIKA
jgi:hypothetical protein